MEDNNKAFIFISNDKETDTTIKIDYRSFVFFDVYGLENDKIYKIVEFEDRMFYFLECSLLFPPQALRYDCYFCWEKLDSGELQAYWTSDFPEEELKQYVEKLR